MRVFIEFFFEENSNYFLFLMIFFKHFFLFFNFNYLQLKFVAYIVFRKKSSV